MAKESPAPAEDERRSKFGSQACKTHFLKNTLVANDSQNTAIWVASKFPTLIASVRDHRGTSGFGGAEMRRLLIYNFFAAQIAHWNECSEKIRFQTRQDNYPFSSYQGYR